MNTDEATYRAVLGHTQVLNTIAASPILDGLDAAIELGERSLTLGPFLDPTLFMRSRDALQAQLRVMRAIREYRAVLLAESAGLGIEAGT